MCWLFTIQNKYTYKNKSRAFGCYYENTENVPGILQQQQQQKQEWQQQTMTVHSTKHLYTFWSNKHRIHFKPLTGLIIIILLYMFKQHSGDKERWLPSPSTYTLQKGAELFTTKYIAFQFKALNQLDLQMEENQNFTFNCCTLNCFHSSTQWVIAESMLFRM